MVAAIYVEERLLTSALFARADLNGEIFVGERIVVRLDRE